MTSENDACHTYSLYEETVINSEPSIFRNRTGKLLDRGPLSGTYSLLSVANYFLGYRLPRNVDILYKGWLKTCPLSHCIKTMSQQVEAFV